MVLESHRTPLSDCVMTTAFFRFESPPYCMAYIAHGIRPVSWYDHPPSWRSGWPCDMVSAVWGGGHSRCRVDRSDFRQSIWQCRNLKKAVSGRFFDDNSSNNLTIDVGTHPGGREDHRRSYKLETTSSYILVHFA